MKFVVINLQKLVTLITTFHLVISIGDGPQ